jgi:hypothetical protein
MMGTVNLRPHILEGADHFRVRMLVISLSLRRLPPAGWRAV